MSKKAIQFVAPKKALIARKERIENEKQLAKKESIEKMKNLSGKLIQAIGP